MSRIEKFKSEEQDRINTLISDEITIRAVSAVKISEPFKIDGVEFKPGCDGNGIIRVESGIQKLAKLIGKEIKIEQKTGYTTPFYSYSFEHNGAIFEQIEYRPLKLIESEVEDDV